MSSVAHCYGTCGRPDEMTNIGLSNYLLFRYKGTKGGWRGWCNLPCIEPLDQRTSPGTAGLSTGNWSEGRRHPDETGSRSQTSEIG